MSNHDHSKVEVDALGNVTAMVDSNGNAVSLLPSLGDTRCSCPAYGRYIDRRVSHPAEDPRASARWANDWPASIRIFNVADIPRMYPYEATGTGAITLGEGGVGRSWTVKEVQRVESAQDEYPPVYDRPTFFLCVLIAALAGMLVGLIAGAMVMT